MATGKNEGARDKRGKGKGTLEKNMDIERGEGNRNAQYIPLEVGKRYISREVYVNINQTIILVHLNLF